MGPQIHAAIDAGCATSSIWNGVFAALGSGVVASLLVLVSDRLWTAGRLRRCFKDLPGTYEHFNLANEPCASPGHKAQTQLRYKGKATFEATSETEYGAWEGRIKMDPNLPTFGSGTFFYSETTRGSGFIQLIVLGDTDILVQATAINFVGSSPGVYIWRKTG